jgi:hypothetical protein
LCGRNRRQSYECTYCKQELAHIILSFFGTEVNRDAHLSGACWATAERLLVALTPSKDLIICAKDLFIEAMVGPMASAYQEPLRRSLDHLVG